MRKALIIIFPLVAVSTPAHAQQAEAKEAARSANCKPGKVEALRTTAGRMGETVYKVECQGQKDVFVIVRCKGQLCALTK